VCSSSAWEANPLPESAHDVERIEPSGKSPLRRIDHGSQEQTTKEQCGGLTIRRIASYRIEGLRLPFGQCPNDSHMLDAIDADRSDELAAWSDSPCDLSMPASSEIGIPDCRLST
jgi:hypothetical protein